MYKFVTSYRVTLYTSKIFILENCNIFCEILNIYFLTHTQTHTTHTNTHTHNILKKMSYIKLIASIQKINI